MLITMDEILDAMSLLPVTHHPEERRRVARSIGIIRNGAIKVVKAEKRNDGSKRFVFSVKSQNKNKTYHVTVESSHSKGFRLRGCTCPDYRKEDRRREKKLCKHSMAVILFIRNWGEK